MDKSPGIKGRRTIEEVAHNRALQDQSEYHVDVENRVANLERRGGGMAVYEIKIFEDINVVVVGDGKFWWPIPAELDLAEIIKVETGISTVSSSGPVELQLRHFTANGTVDSGDVLTNKAAITVGNKNDDNTATVTGGTRVLHDGDWLRCDVDAAGSGAKGLAVMVTCTPSPLGSVTIQGAKGDPGGVTAWTGAYSVSITYVTNEAVSYGGNSYVAIQQSINIIPGVTAGWENYWMLLTQSPPHSSIEMLVTGAGWPIDVGRKGWAEVPFNCTLVQATLLADAAANMVVDIRKDSYGNFPPTVGDSITSASPLTLAGSNKTQDTTLAGWTTAFTQGDILSFDVVSNNNIITQATVSLKIARI